MEDTEIQPAQAPPLATVQQPTPPTKTRTVPLWAALGATAAGVLVAFGVGYAINAADAGAASERDELSLKVDRVSKERDGAEASLAVARAAVDECRAAVDEASVLADQADDFTGDWETMLDLFLQWEAAPIGSPEEAEMRQPADCALDRDGRQDRRARRVRGPSRGRCRAAGRPDEISRWGHPSTRSRKMSSTAASKPTRGGGRGA